jgi:hypothetical protein
MEGVAGDVVATDKQKITTLYIFSVDLMTYGIQKPDS